MFECSNKRCGLKKSVTHEEVKLLKTKVVNTSGTQPINEWAIFTCPSCHETFLLDKRTPMYKEAPSVTISNPFYEGKE